MFSFLIFNIVQHKLYLSRVNLDFVYFVVDIIKVVF
jgi:hypothetical protein